MTIGVTGTAAPPRGHAGSLQWQLQRPRNVRKHTAHHGFRPVPGVTSAGFIIGNQLNSVQRAPVRGERFSSDRSLLLLLLNVRHQAASRLPGCQAARQSAAGDMHRDIISSTPSLPVSVAWHPPPDPMGPHGTHGDRAAERRQHRSPWEQHRTAAGAERSGSGVHSNCFSKNNGFRTYSGQTCTSGSAAFY